jgi:hypothetical protein
MTIQIDRALPRSIGSFLGLTNPDDFDLPDLAIVRTMGSVWKDCYFAEVQYEARKRAIFADGLLSNDGRNAKLKELAQECLKPYPALKSKVQAAKEQADLNEISNLSTQAPKPGALRDVMRESQLVEMLLKMDRAVRTNTYRTAIEQKNLELLSAACNANPALSLVTADERKAINMALKTPAEIQNQELVRDAITSADFAISMSESYIRSDSGSVGTGDALDSPHEAV